MVVTAYDPKILVVLYRMKDFLFQDRFNEYK